MLLLLLVLVLLMLVLLLLFVAPHTPNPWGHVELVSKDAGIG